MPQDLTTIDDRPLVYIRDGEIRANSIDVSNQFKKDHKNVLAWIKHVTELAAKFGNRLNFKPVAYLDSKGRRQPSIDMDREGFENLALGFTGERAMEFRMRYVAEFHRMEREIAANKPGHATAPTLDMRDPLQLAAAFQQVMEIAREAQDRAAREEEQKHLAIAYIDEVAPKVTFAKEVEASEKLMTLSQAARLLEIDQRRFFEHVKGRYVFMEDGSLVPYARYRREGLFKVKYPTANGRERPQTYVTGMGMAVLKAEFASRRPHDLLSQIDHLPKGITRSRRQIVGSWVQASASVGGRPA